jgi:hypothetical protein
MTSVPCHEDVWGVVDFMPWPFYFWGNSPWYPLDRRLGDPRASLDTVEKRKISCPCWGKNPCGSPHCPLLYQLSYTGSFYSLIIETIIKN